MPTTIFGSQSFSGIGTEVRNVQHFTAICATQDIDLASHLLPPGDHAITINVVLGNVNVYIPSNVHAVLDGMVLFGTTNSFDDGKGWRRYVRRFGNRSRSGMMPVAFPDAAGTIRLRIRINGLLGSVRIYRLSGGAELVRPGMVAVGA